ncbi:HET-domain-containing protein [Hypoxylon trugodes]|uniref:HET-domain-containing protein n=1 Tax=Hypoxylon trugodes TaxID=326681 RepID=UPI0021976A7A|nr:HET-domain-containing protein [Hypoxylon trugodes]KAI1385003.1 HET-domain-containing protein [Hypoxylon trugodes]
MWLLNTETLSLEAFGEAEVRERPYAILSHTWGTEEVLFHELQGGRAAVEHRAGWTKTTSFCATALECGFAYAWMDTCCIDKRNSADLSEAINSMNKYYYDAAVCFIHLEDVQVVAQSMGTLATREQLIAGVCASRWLTRGWTLQELVTPCQRRFFAADWSEIDGGVDLLDAIAKSTEISRALLEDRDQVFGFCVGERIKWIAKRQTTREEDMAYSLMGLCKVNMPVLYGEGAANAFGRLQREIMQSSFDMSIFAWRGDYESSGLLAQSPADFATVPPLRLWAPWSLAPFSMTNVGLSIRVNITDEEQIRVQGNFKEPPDDGRLLAALQCDVQTPTGQWQIPLIHLEPVESATFFVNGKIRRAYRRIQCAEWITIPSQQLSGCPYKDVLVLQNEQYELVRRATEQHMSRWKKRGG